MSRNSIRVAGEDPGEKQHRGVIIFAGLTRNQLRDGYGLSHGTIGKLRRGEVDRLGPETIMRLQRIRGWTRSMVLAEILRQSALSDLAELRKKGQ